MKQEKNNFLLYKDFKSTIDILTDEQAGKLIKAVFAYVNGRVEPNFKDGMLIVAFNVLKSQLERDLKKYKEIAEKNRENGKKGGRPPKQKQSVIEKPKETERLLKNQTVKNKPKKADRDRVRDSVRDRVKDSDMKEIKHVYFTDNELEELFQDFLKQRKKLKAVNSERAINTLINKLEELSGGDIQEKKNIIERSIMNSWKGVFPSKNIKEQPKPKNEIKGITVV